MRALALVLVAVAAIAAAGERHCTGACRVGYQRPEYILRMMERFDSSRGKLKLQRLQQLQQQQQQQIGSRQSLPTESTTCVNGRAGPFRCSRVDMLSRVPRQAMGTLKDIADLWGWVDPQTNKEYALVTAADGTAIVDVTDPTAPQVLVRIPSQSGASARSYWRDVKTYGTTAYIVADAVAGHGIQVFDLTRLRGATGPMEIVRPDYVYTEHGSAHNVFIHEETGFGYSVGSDTCSYGLHIFDLRTDPLRPTFVGCVYDDKAPAQGTGNRRGYSHDIQCVVYAGPDAAYTGREICVSYGEDELLVFDVTDKTVADANTQRINAPILSATSYPGVRYTHQGWFTADHKYILVNDELDESGRARRPTTFLFDMSSLQAPKLLGTSQSPAVAIDHNLFIKDNLVYMSNYQSGLRVDDITPMTAGTGTQLPEVGFFQTQLADSPTAVFIGSWGNYPFLPSNNVLVTDIEGGLFVLRLQPPTPSPTSSPTFAGQTLAPSASPSAAPSSAALPSSQPTATREATSAPTTAPTSSSKPAEDGNLQGAAEDSDGAEGVPGATIGMIAGGGALAALAGAFCLIRGGGGGGAGDLEKGGAGPQDAAPGAVKSKA